ncbi:MAG TPA: SIMPL domain-containing protein [Candidatus Paceibacterota bacterium]
MDLKKYHINLSSEELNSFLKGAGIICLGLLSLFILVKTVSEIKQYPTIGNTPGQNVISVAGNAEMFIKPDITTFTWTVEGEGATIEKAQTAAAEKGNKAVEFLKEKGIKEADLKTTGYYTNTKYDTQIRPCAVSAARPANIEPASPDMAVSMPAVTSVGVTVPPCSNTDQVAVGYTTIQTVEVKVRKINDNPELTSQLVAGLGSIGAKVSSPRSTVDEPEKYQQKVRQEAIIKARNEAEVLARTLGVKLVRVVSYNDNSYPVYPMYDMAMSARAEAGGKAVAPSLPTGTNKISSDVTVTFEIR